jgi:predicted amidophosphoribosyltransferase
MMHYVIHSVTVHTATLFWQITVQCNTPTIHIMRLTNSPLCSKCGAEEETSAHVLCECEALAMLRHIYLGSVFLDPEDIRGLSLGAIWNFFKKGRLS